jgi:acyl-CoA thioester hydrolase
MAYVNSVQVRFYELDPYDHVNHAVYFSYFETARIEALSSVGYDLTRLREEGFHLVVTDVRARFHRPAVYGEVLEITSRLIESKRVTSRWGQVATVEGEVVATLELTGAITDAEGRPRRAPAGFLEAIEPLRS